MTARNLRLLGLSLLGTLLLGPTGCKTEAFCWDECGPAADGSGGGGPITGTGGAISLIDAGPDSDPSLDGGAGPDDRHPDRCHCGKGEHCPVHGRLLTNQVLARPLGPADMFRTVPHPDPEVIDEFHWPEPLFAYRS